MRRKGIYFGYAGHKRHQGRTYGTPGTNQISIFIGLCHQLLGDQIHNGKSVLDDGIQLFVQPGLNDFRQRVAIQFMSPAESTVLYGLFAALNMRRTFFRGNRADRFTQIRDPVCVGHNHFIGLFLSQIGKLLQHLLRRPEIQRRLIVRILVSLACLQYPSVYLILRVHKMDISGCCHRFSQLFPQSDDLPVDFL